MTILAIRNCCLLAWMAMALGSCALGGGGGGGTLVAGGGIGGTGITSGTVTGFGSIEANGAVYDTSNASFTVDGQAGATQNDLKVGQVVTMKFTISGISRNATSVLYEDTVEGTVESVAGDNLSLVVLGQTVQVTNTTIIDNSIPGQDIANLVPLVDVVEVSGHVKADGVIVATFIEKKTLPIERELKGFVKNHNNVAQTFAIGMLTVDYSTADIGNMPDPSTTWNDLVVEVKGNSLVGGVLTGTIVELEEHGIVEGDLVEVEDFVTTVLGPGDFLLGGNVRFQTTTSTIFSGGTLAEIDEGVKLEVDGVSVNGVVIATKVSFRDSVKLESDVASVTVDLVADPTGKTGTLTLEGLPGITVMTNSQTEFKGQGNPTSLNDLAVGVHLRIRGRPGTGNTVIASRVEGRSVSTVVILQGVVESAADPNLVILGVTADTSTIPSDRFEDINDVSIGRAAFFNAATPGSLVKVKGTLNAGNVTWDQEAELED